MAIIVKIDGAAPFYSIDSLQISKALQSHPVLELGGILEFEKHPNFSPLEWKDQTISVLITNDLDPDQGAKPLFNGFLTKIILEQSCQNLYCRIEAKGVSFKMDQKPQTRFFQDGSQTYGTVLEYIFKFYDKLIRLQSVDLCSTQKLDHLLIQYEETDWEFLQRICRRLKTVCFLADEDTPGKIYLDKQEKEAVKSDFFTISVNSDTEEVELKTWELYYLGNQLSFSGKDYTIAKIEHRLEQNVIKNYYSLREKNLNKTESSNDRLKGVTLKAKVTDNKDSENKGRIKITFVAGEDLGKDLWPNCRQFPFITAYSSNEASGGAGFFSLPEIGETVLVNFGNGMEDDAVICGVIRDNSDKNLSDPTHKIWRNSKGREVRITDNELILSAKDNEVLITLDDQKIELKNKDALIQLMSKEAKINYGESEFLLNKNEILLKCGSSQIKVSNGKIELSDGSSAGLILNGKSSLEGSTINLNSSGEMALKGSQIGLKGSKINLN